MTSSNLNLFIQEESDVQNLKPRFNDGKLVVSSRNGRPITGCYPPCLDLRFSYTKRFSGTFNPVWYIPKMSTTCMDWIIPNDYIIMYWAEGSKDINNQTECDVHTVNCRFSAWEDNPGYFSRKGSGIVTTSYVPKQLTTKEMFHYGPYLVDFSLDEDSFVSSVDSEVPLKSGSSIRCIPVGAASVQDFFGCGTQKDELVYAPPDGIFTAASDLCTDNGFTLQRIPLISGQLVFPSEGLTSLVLDSNYNFTLSSNSIYYEYESTYNQDSWVKNDFEPPTCEYDESAKTKAKLIGGEDSCDPPDDEDLTSINMYSLAKNVIKGIQSSSSPINYDTVSFAITHNDHEDWTINPAGFVDVFDPALNPDDWTSDPPAEEPSLYATSASATSTASYHCVYNDRNPGGYATFSSENKACRVPFSNVSESDTLLISNDSAYNVEVKYVITVVTYTDTLIRGEPKSVSYTTPEMSIIVNAGSTASITFSPQQYESMTGNPRPSTLFGVPMSFFVAGTSISLGGIRIV